MLVRDAPGLEVFMLRRNLRSVFVAGAYVFPGGAVDSEDRERPLLDAVAGVDEATAAERITSPGALGFWVAATVYGLYGAYQVYRGRPSKKEAHRALDDIRESVAEAGVLLARDRATSAPITVDAGTSAELDRDRRALLDGSRSFHDIVLGRDLVLDGGALAPVAHYITPPGAPRRYDTWFFVAAAPAGHAYEHDDDETVASTWIRPLDALEQARREEIELIFPTFRSLEALAQFETAAEVLTAVDDAWRDGPSAQTMEDAGHGWMLGFADIGDAGDAMRHSVRTGGRGRRVQSSS